MHCGVRKLCCVAPAQRAQMVRQYLKKQVTILQCSVMPYDAYVSGK